MNFPIVNFTFLRSNIIFALSNKVCASQLACQYDTFLIVQIIRVSLTETYSSHKNCTNRVPMQNDWVWSLTLCQATITICWPTRCGCVSTDLWHVLPLKLPVERLFCILTYCLLLLLRPFEWLLSRMAYGTCMKERRKITKGHTNS